MAPRYGLGRGRRAVRRLPRKRLELAREEPAGVHMYSQSAIQRDVLFR